MNNPTPLAEIVLADHDPDRVISAAQNVVSVLEWKPDDHVIIRDFVDLRSGVRLDYGLHIQLRPVNAAGDHLVMVRFLSGLAGFVLRGNDNAGSGARRTMIVALGHAAFLAEKSTRSELPDMPDFYETMVGDLVRPAA